MLTASGCGGGSAPSLPAMQRVGQSSGSSHSPIQHVVLVIQENRSFDDFFAHFPGADGTRRGKMKVKVGSQYVDKWVTLQKHALFTNTDIQHCHKAYRTDYDAGKMDGFNTVYLGVCGAQGKQAGTVPYQYVNPSDIAPYWDIAERWVLSDHMFQTQGSGSFTAHQDLIRGGTQINQKYSLVDNPSQMPWGCDYLGMSKTSLITKSGQYVNLVKKGPPPCTSKFPQSGASYKTLRDLLDAAAVGWKYYSPCFIGWNQSGCDNGCDYTCAGATLNAYDMIAPVRYGSEWGTNVSMPETNIFDDITNGTLPAVSWVIPSDANSDHPGEACKCDDGPSWVASVVDAIGQSSYWNSSVIIVMWDDWGGFYDHVAPQQLDWGGLGFRVPMMILSPYAKIGSGSKGGYISSTPYEFGSILKYIENNWNLGSLGTSDQRATSIGDVLDYTQQPRQFTSIPSQRSIEFFKRRAMEPQHGDPQ
jgi:phospholipase C